MFLFNNNCSIFSFLRRTSIAKTSRVYAFSKLRDSFVDEYTYISYWCDINNATFGKFCSIGNSVKIGLGSHPLDFVSTSPIFYSVENPLRRRIIKNNMYQQYKNVFIGNDVWIGANTTIKDGVQIGDGAVIGTRSLVVRDVSPYEIVGGVPARFIRYRFEREIVEELLRVKWWNYTLKELSSVNINGLFSRKVDMRVINEISYKLKQDNLFQLD